MNDSPKSLTRQRAELKARNFRRVNNPHTIVNRLRERVASWQHDLRDWWNPIRPRPETKPKVHFVKSDGAVRSIFFTTDSQIDTLWQLADMVIDQQHERVLGSAARCRQSPRAVWIEEETTALRPCLRCGKPFRPNPCNQQPASLCCSYQCTMDHIHDTDNNPTQPDNHGPIQPTAGEQ